MRFWRFIKEAFPQFGLKMPMEAQEAAYREAVRVQRAIYEQARAINESIAKEQEGVSSHVHFAFNREPQFSPDVVKKAMESHVEALEVNRLTIILK